jgi:hypothetical protein
MVGSLGSIPAAFQVAGISRCPTGLPFLNPPSEAPVHRARISPFFRAVDSGRIRLSVRPGTDLPVMSLFGQTGAQECPEKLLFSLACSEGNPKNRP